MNDNSSQCILDRIVADKRLEVQAAAGRIPLADVRADADAAGPVRDFEAAFRAEPPAGIHLLAEIKHASPSAGEICPIGDFAAVARAFQECGAAAISVLTDEKYFKGSVRQMVEVRNAVDLPVLRKEFIIDAYQVYESRAAGADAILLMTQILADAELGTLLELTHALGMTALVEGHSEEEVRRAVSCGARVIGINNRDLRTFDTDLETTGRRIALVPPDRVVISQSAIKTRADVVRIVQTGARAIQVGESLMRSGDVAAGIKRLLGL
jgi:indole-3-glycerol phosphate synthase